LGGARLVTEGGFDLVVISASAIMLYPPDEGRKKQDRIIELLSPSTANEKFGNQQAPV
jgi:hypothetical protein